MWKKLVNLGKKAAAWWKRLPPDDRRRISDNAEKLAARVLKK